MRDSDAKRLKLVDGNGVKKKNREEQRETTTRKIGWRLLFFGIGGTDRRDPLK